MTPINVMIYIGKTYINVAVMVESALLLGQLLVQFSATNIQNC